MKRIKIITFWLFCWGLACSAHGQSLDSLLLRLGKESAPAARAQLAYRVGKHYLARQIYNKARAYFEQASVGAQDAKKTQLLHDIWVDWGYACLQQTQLPEAEKIYTQLLQDLPAGHALQPSVLESLVNVYRLQNKPEEALARCKQLATVCQQKGDLPKYAAASNNAGFLAKLVGKPQEAEAFFRQALEANKQQAAKETDIASLANLGFTYTYLKRYAEAERTYYEALGIAKAQKNTEKQTMLLNYIAVEKYLSGQYEEAATIIQQATALGEQQKHENILLESYQAAIDIFQKTEELKKLQQATKRYNELKDALAQRKRRAELEIAQNQLEAERHENELNSLVAERDKQTLELRNAQTEAEKKAKENELQKQLLANLEKDRRLQEAEAHRQKSERLQAEQQLEISRQKLIAAEAERKNEEALAHVEKQRAVQTLQYEKQKRLAEVAEFKRKETLQQQQARDKQAKVEADRLNFLLWAGVAFILLVLLVLAVVVRSYLIGRRQQRIIQKQKDAIEANQEELRQNFEELQATQESLQEKNDALLASEEELKQNLEELQATQDALQERKESLEIALKELSEAQNHLVHSEKMAALGQLVASVAHEINTPLGAINSSIAYIRQSLQAVLPALPIFFKTLSFEDATRFDSLLGEAVGKQVLLSSREQRRIKQQLSDILEEEGITDAYDVAGKLVDIGLYEGIEPYLALIKNPDALDMACKIMMIQNSSRNIEAAVGKLSKIIFALKNFARHDSHQTQSLASIQETIETVLTIYHNNLKQGVEVVRQYADLPDILCYGEELMQVWTNLIHNAIQAKATTLTITTQWLENPARVLVSLADTGHGIPDNIKDKIFQAFFTTKRMGEGSGLGLDIVRKIVEKHAGKIYFESQEGVGTTFFVEIPAKVGEG